MRAADRPLAVLPWAARVRSPCRPSGPVRPEGVQSWVFLVVPYSSRRWPVPVWVSPAWRRRCRARRRARRVTWWARSRVGYQGWFACIGDGAPINGWWHWSQNWGQPPSPTQQRHHGAGRTCASTPPPTRPPTPTSATASPRTLFSSYDQQTVDTHFLWMQQNGCDTAALQRFNPNGGEGPTRDAMAAKVRVARPRRYGRKFYIMYDVTGWTNMQSEIKTDWTTKMSAHTASSAYARQNGKPVVCIWGFGFNDANHPWDAGHLPGRHQLVQGPGLLRHRRRATRVAHRHRRLPGRVPRRVPRVQHDLAVDGRRDRRRRRTPTRSTPNINVPDQADCNANGIDYQPCVLPGDVSARQRVHGDFMWRQFYNMVRVGAQGIYISMFDEYNEGNQIAKTAETQADDARPAPACSRWTRTARACSSDYYLRLTDDGGRMLKGQIALTADPADPARRRRRRRRPAATWPPARPTAASSHNGGLPGRQRGRRQPGQLLGERQQRLPAVDPGRPRRRGRGQPRRAQAAAGWGARTQTLSVQGSTDGSSFTTVLGSAGVHLRPGRGQHGHRHASGHHRPLRAAQHHRQHRLARRPAVRVRGVRHRRQAGHPGAHRAGQPDRHRPHRDQRRRCPGRRPPTTSASPATRCAAPVPSSAHVAVPRSRSPA